ncbi:type I restriction enzyme HsdR N-terminal domain-containing protein [Flagellimonas sp.]|uniref:type I restriction enzyme HsdR N-terminal domain-containing protein n=1 Tax=Flagellimonas sp. TaxID=2058762 RepID=UPI003F49E9C0
MQVLNFPSYSFRIKSNEKGLAIFDVIRKKFVVLQPEEWVRQHAIHYLMETKGYPKIRLNVEKQLQVNKLNKRYDIVVFNSQGGVDILVECKAPDIAINQEVFDQIARYNYQLKANFLMVTNGLSHYYCKTNYQNEKYSFLKDIPDFRR